jgi:3-hydroxyacyl-[acyl-carrier-protein] dehydratase
MPKMNKPLYNLDDIKHRIPHREPILMVDEVLEYEPQKFTVGQRSFKVDDPLFAGHFPENPVLPGMLLYEAIAQTGALLVALDYDLTASTATYLFMGIKNARLLHPVRPGDTLVMRAEKQAEKMGVFKFHGSATVNDKLCAEADFAAKLIRNNQMSLGF